MTERREREMILEAHIIIQGAVLLILLGLVAAYIVDLTPKIILLVKRYFKV